MGKLFGKNVQTSKEKCGDSKEIIFFLCNKIFIPKFWMCVQNFWTCVRNFGMCVQNFWTKIFAWLSENISEEQKQYFLGVITIYVSNYTGAVSARQKQKKHKMFLFLLLLCPLIRFFAVTLHANNFKLRVMNDDYHAENFNGFGR